jgi:hypothetical protein
VQGKYEESFAEFKHAGTTAQAHANLAYTQAQLGDIDLAMGNLNRALSLDSTLKAATIELIQLNDLKKRFDVAPQAENALVKHEQLPPKSAGASALATVLDRQTMKGPQGDRLAARDAAHSDVRAQAATTEVSDLIDSVVDAKNRAGCSNLPTNTQSSRA